ncbi:hypothetical protein [Sphingomicrobium marinum]|uniref:hypothetical protein n=1 Tax=Sphingomicrobium marinum TaxID=1227950 RepID=UPI00223F08B5|nr:hypothetical protein [Sphingomicrobium marinum]
MRAAALAPILALAACEGGEAPDAANNDTANEVAAPSAPVADIDNEALAGVMYEALKDDLSSPDSLRLQTGATDLDGDGEAEVLAYAIDPMICGTGGCSLYVLRKAGDSYRILDQIGPSQLPVYKLAAGEDGWAELGITVYGGGVAERVMAVPHGEAGYARNPTGDPAYQVVDAGNDVIIAAPEQP